MNVLANKTVYLLDMDGTIYLGDELIEGAKSFVETIKKEDYQKSEKSELSL